MTREALFRTQVEAQLAIVTTWQHAFTDARIARGADNLAPSDFPAFTCTMGETRYTAFDSFGHPTEGEQDFTITVLYLHPQLSIAPALITRSDYILQLETFFAGQIALPMVSTGDTFRFDAVYLRDIQPPSYSIRETRASIVARGRYTFTLI